MYDSRDPAKAGLGQWPFEGALSRPYLTPISSVSHKFRFGVAPEFETRMHEYQRFLICCLTFA
jgi:hypothetical protein